MAVTRRRKVLITLLIIICGWLIFAQYGMSYRISDAKAKKEYAAKGVNLIAKTFTENNFSLHYAQAGNDTLPTLFFVHGSPGSWIKFGEYFGDTVLAKKFRLIGVDRPGFGYSNFGKPMNLFEQEKIITGFLKSIQNDKPIYALGRSYGGPLIVQLAAANPEMFSGLFLFAAALDPAAEKPEKWRNIISKKPFEYFVPGAWKQSNKELMMLKDDLVTLSGRFDAITCPVYIMHGDADKLVPLSNTEYAKRKFVNAKSITIKIEPGGGHFISEYKFEEIKNILLGLY
jgi:pimeloyl-ACP methyl ester carboxylesterase